jgi:hypothetical protein
MTCPYCHAVEVFGVRLPSLKAAILDRIRHAGDIGVTSLEIVADLYRDRRSVSLNTVKAHIRQINTLLEETDWIIRSERWHGSTECRWCLGRRRVRRAA